MFLNTFKLFNEESIPTCTISVFVIMLQFTVHIENIHAASTISQDNQLQAWKFAEQQNRPCTSVSASGKSSGTLIMANKSQLKFPIERELSTTCLNLYKLSKKNSNQTSPCLNVTGAKVTSAASEETETCFPPKLSWLLQVQTYNFTEI